MMKISCAGAMRTYGRNEYFRSVINYSKLEIPNEKGYLFVSTHFYDLKSY